MRKVDAAEWLLSLTTTTERAASTAGDLQEQSAAHGTFWFWASALRTTASLLWSSFTASPFRFAGLALRAAVISSWYMLLLVTGILMVHGLIAVMVLHYNTPELVRESFDSMYVVEGTISLLVASFPFGKWLAKKAPHQELTVLAFSWVAFRAFWVLILLLSGSARAAFSPMEVIYDLLLTVGCTPFVLAGIARGRRRYAQS